MNKYCYVCGARVDKWNIDKTRNVICGKCTMSSTNLVTMLEKMYDIEIKNTADYSSAYNTWQSMGKPINVALIASQSVRRGIVATPADPIQRVEKWNYKDNPIKWEDQ